MSLVSSQRFGFLNVWQRLVSFQGLKDVGSNPAYTLCYWDHDQFNLYVIGALTPIRVNYYSGR